VSDYQPHLIAPLKNGLELGMEPWLTPSGAFRKLRNAYVRRGVLQKRQGYALWNRLVHAVEEEAIGSSGSTTYTGTIDNTPLRPGDLSFTDGTLEIVDDGDGTLSGDGDGTINYTTGAYSVTFSGTTTGAVTADYDYYPGLPVTSIDKFQTTDGALYFLACDTERINLFNTGTQKFEDLTGADEFTGGAGNCFWTEIIGDVFYLTNNVDRPFYYNGTTFAELLMDTDGDADNDVTTALLLIAYKSRLVALCVTEGGNLFPQRARWSSPVSAGVVADFSNDEHADAPTSDWIVSAEFVGEDLIVFFAFSVWKLRYTGDADAPFRWEQVTKSDGSGAGSFATLSTWSLDDYLYTVGSTSIIRTDGLTVMQESYEKVPDIVIDFDRTLITRCYSIVIEEKDLVLLLYPTIGATVLDKVLAYNYVEKSWSDFDLSFNCFGYYQAEDDPAWDDVEETWDELERSWDDRTSQAGYPTTVAGDESGNIWQLFSGGDDNGSDIELEIESAQWNPYSSSGKKARLGYLDILVERDADISFTVDFYCDHNPTAYLSEEVTCDSDNNVEDNVWKRIYVGETGNFHKIRISHTASAQTLKIHALMPWFKPAGRLNG
jgi:hypothetical protein